jgi:hypothetical protein
MTTASSASGMTAASSRTAAAATAACSAGKGFRSHKEDPKNKNDNSD